MGAEPARVLDFPDDYLYGSAAPAGAAGLAELPEIETAPGERVRTKEKTDAAPQHATRVSLFAVFGSLFAGVLMVFVVLAQISYNEIAGETVSLNAQYADLTQQQRRLEITFESVIDMKEIERYARDVLGMSRPETDQVTMTYNASGDRVEVLPGGDDKSPLHDLGSFISSLLEYFKR